MIFLEEFAHWLQTGWEKTFTGHENSVAVITEAWSSFWVWFRDFFVQLGDTFRNLFSG